MSRLTKLPVEAWDPELRDLAQADSASELERGITRMLAHAPEMAKGALGFGAAVTLNRTLPERLVELVRLRVAFHNQCRSCMAIRYASAADTVDEDLVCSLEMPQEAVDLAPDEKAAIEFADRFATDHLGITAQRFDALREYFSEPEIVELLLHCALYVGMGRLAAVLDMTEELPAGFRVPFGERVTPTADKPVRVR